MTTSSRRPEFCLLALLIALAAVALPALASTPANGEISNAAPSITWKGNAGGYGTDLLDDVNGSFPQCQAPTCDEFSLNVKDGGNLTVTLSTDDKSPFMAVEVEDPAGTKHYDGGSDSSETTTIKLKGAKPGAYIVRAQTNNPPAQGDAYTGTATLGTTAPAATSTPAAGATPGPSSTPAGGGTPPQGSSTSATITVKAGKLSAKKLAKSHKFTLTVSSTAPLSAVKGTVRKGKKVVGTGTLSQLASSAKLAIKVKGKPKAGTYNAQVTGKTSDGRIVGTTVRLKIGR